jgi:penicillin-binding protein 1C
MTGLLAATWLCLAPLPETLDPPPGTVRRARVVDRRGEPLSVTYENTFNVLDTVALHEVPLLLREAVLEAEDRRYFEHWGVDWRARGAAIVQNVRAGRTVRGASTIGEQVARMLTPRPRSPWSRWLEGFEARRLERRFGKAAVFEFYLNQVPYGGRWRGVVQAAHEYFDRDLSTLTPKEMLAMAVIVRSPARLDPRRPSSRIEAAIAGLARRLGSRGVLAERQIAALASEPLELDAPRLATRAPHFSQHARARAGPGVTRVRTTLDGALQRSVQALLDVQLVRLASRDAGDGAALVVDHARDEVLAWVNAGEYSDEPGSQIDAVLAARQPGSTLKPFLYALALDRGYTAASLLDDSPLAEAVGSGLHRYRNYSRTHHGLLRLREALGNSLNVPAARLVHALTPRAFQATLRDAGMTSLSASAEHYGHGLALGNAEVTLVELVGAYSVLARGGEWRPLHVLLEPAEPPEARRRVFSVEAATLVADILSDPAARRLEFGAGGLLELPVQTAVKTGTSTDYRDAWAVGFTHRHTVGVWMGNLDRREMNGVSGSIGPAIVLRAIFAELARTTDSRPLPLSRSLRRVPICAASGAAPGPECPVVEEWFRERELPRGPCQLHGASPRRLTASRDGAPARLVQPTSGLHLALDPRIPDEFEAFAFEIAAARPPAAVEWFVDDVLAGTTGTGERRFAWPLARGEHVVHARARFDGVSEPHLTQPVRFVVK